MINKIVDFYLEYFTLITIVLLVLFGMIVVFYLKYKKKINSLYKKHKEIISYIIVGGLTTVISITSYWLFRLVIEVYLVNVILSWIAAVLFAYITNRLFVFKSKNKSIVNEIVKFVSYRLLTLVIEIIIMFLLVDIIKTNDMFAKILVQFIILVLNYIFSKFFVFMNK